MITRRSSQQFTIFILLYTHCSFPMVEESEGYQPSQDLPDTFEIQQLLVPESLWNYVDFTSEDKTPSPKKLAPPGTNSASQTISKKTKGSKKKQVNKKRDIGVSKIAALIPKDAKYKVECPNNCGRTCTSICYLDLCNNLKRHLEYHCPQKNATHKSFESIALESCQVLQAHLWRIIVKCPIDSCETEVYATDRITSIFHSLTKHIKTHGARKKISKFKGSNLVEYILGHNTLSKIDVTQENQAQILDLTPTSATAVSEDEESNSP